MKNSPSSRKSVGVLVLMCISFAVLLTGCEEIADIFGIDLGGNVGSVTGRVTYIGVLDHSGIVITLESFDGEKVSTTESSADGTYELADLDVGEYTVYASSEIALERVVSTNVRVVAGQAVGVDDLQLTATGTISGTIAIDGGSTELLGLMAFIAGTSYVAVTDEQGAFSITYVPVGTDYLLVAAKGDSLSEGILVEVRAGETTDVGAITLQIDGATGGGTSGGVVAPVLIPGGAVFGEPVMVTIFTTTAGASIRYTTDGVSTPDSTNGNLYEGPINVEHSQTIKVVAYTASDTSIITVEDYTINIVEAPTFSLAEDTYAETQETIISTVTEGATIYYTLDGTIPTPGHYDGFGTGSITITVDQTMTVMAMAIRDSWTDSTVTSASYSIILAPPVFELSQGTYIDRIRVTWTAVPGATGYRVYRATSELGTYEVIADTDATSYDDESAIIDTQYYYKLDSYNDVEASGLSAAVSGFAQFPVPATVSATDGSYSDRVRISWDAVTVADGYLVYRANAADGTYSEIGNVTGTSYDDTTATVGITYYYKVSAHGVPGESVQSDPDSGYAQLTKPYLTTNSTKYTYQIVLSWSSVSGATGYRIARALTYDGTYTQVVDTTSASYIDTDVTPGELYYYKGLAYDGNGDSGYSGVAYGYTSLYTPTNMQASDGLFTDKIRVTWSAVTGADEYSVSRSTSSSGTFAEIAVVTGTSYDDTNVVLGTIYYYRVAAVNDSGVKSLSSDADTGHIGILPPPGGISATEGTYLDRVRIAWNSIDGATGYRVYRSTSYSGTYAEIDDVTTTACDDTQAADGVGYYYRIRAYNGDGQSDLSGYDYGYVLAIRQSVRATNDIKDRIVITWDCLRSYMGGAEGFNMYRATSETGSYGYIGSVSASSSSYGDTTAAGGIEYYYKVTTYNTNGETDYSESAAGSRLVPPASVTATDGAFADKVTVSWSAVGGIDWYEVLRSASPTGTYDWQKSTTATSYDDTDVVSGNVYYYKVKSVAGSYTDHTDSDYSDYDSGFATVSAPTGVSATDGTSANSVTVSWSSTTAAVSYSVYRSTSASGTYVAIATGISGTGYTDSTLTALYPTLFHYKVSAKDFAGNESPLSGSDSGYALLSPPTSISATDGTYADRVSITWTANPDAAGYYVYRAASSTGTYSKRSGYLTGTAYDDTAIAGGTVYYYKVTSASSLGESSFTGTDPGYVPLPASGRVQASDGSIADYIAITWTEVEGATGYKLYRATSATGTYTQLSGLASELVWNDTATTGVVYYYKVKATNSATGDGVLSSVYDSGYRKLAAPTGLSASNGTSSTQVQLTWNAVSGASKYNVYRSTSATGTYSYLTQLTPLGSPTTIAYNNSAPESTLYYYKVAATNTATGVGYQSGYDSGYAGILAPVVTASNGTSSSYVFVDWETVENATGYYVYRSTSSASLGTLIDTYDSSVTYHYDYSPIYQYFYYYTVIVENGRGDIAESNHDLGYTY